MGPILTKIATLVQKIPGWILILAGLASIEGQRIIELFTVLSMPKAVVVTKEVIALLLFLAAYIKQSKSIPANDDSPIAVAEAKKASVRPPPLPLLILVAFLSGCSWFQSNAPKVVPPVADLAVCVGEGVAAGESIAEIAVRCKTSIAAVIASLLNSTDPKTQASAAYAEAVKLRATMREGACK